MTLNDRASKNTMVKNNRYGDVADQNPRSVFDIVSTYTSEHKQYRDRKDLNDSLRMKGRSQYRLPDQAALQMRFNQTIQMGHEKAIQELSNSELGMGGRIQLVEKDSKLKLRNEKIEDEDELKKYVTHFS